VSTELDDLYRPPRAQPDDAEQALRPSLPGFASTRVLAKFVAAFVGLTAVSSLVHIALGVYGLWRTEELMTGLKRTGSFGVLDPVMELMPTATASATGAAAVAFLVWVYRVHANIPVLGKRTAVTPGGAVIHYFIPIFNLIRPYQHMMVAWRLSSPTKKRRDDPSPIGWWWAAWIGRLVLTGVVGVLFGPIEETDPAQVIELIQRAGVARMLVEATTVVAAALCIRMVLVLSARQEQSAVRREKRLRKR
jgi:hypothetical protein